MMHKPVSSFEVKSQNPSLRATIIAVPLSVVIFTLLAYVFNNPAPMLWVIIILPIMVLHILVNWSQATKLRVYPDYIEYDKFTGGVGKISKEDIERITLVRRLYRNNFIRISYHSPNENKYLKISSQNYLGGYIEQFKTLGYDVTEITPSERFIQRNRIIQLVIFFSAVSIFVILQKYLEAIGIILTVLAVCVIQRLFSKRR